ncbi:MAG: hypothetical protein HC945_01205 [Nitrosarchaeum sp.]|nr:hypothetical protein [Nitrosarchaeum sp.]
MVEQVRGGQAWSFDLMIGVLVFLLLGVVLFRFVISDENVEKDVATLEQQAKRLADKLSSGPNAIIVDGEADFVQLSALTQMSVEELEELYNERDPFCISVQDANGNIITIEKRTGVGDEALWISGARCGEVLICDEDADGFNAGYPECPSPQGDCNDRNDNVQPGSSNPYCDCNAATGGGATSGIPEICFDGADNDCDGTVDNGCGSLEGPVIPGVVLDPAASATSADDIRCLPVGGHEAGLVYYESWIQKSNNIPLWKFYLPFSFRPPGDVVVKDVTHWENDGLAVGGGTAPPPRFEERFLSRVGVLRFEYSEPSAYQYVLVESDDISQIGDFRRFAVSAWFYQDGAAPPGGRGMLLRPGSWRVISYPDRIEYQDWNTGTDTWVTKSVTPSALPVNRWVHYGLIVSRDVARQYVDNVRVVETDVSTSPPRPTNDDNKHMYIGTAELGVMNWRGAVDDVMFLKTNITEAMLGRIFVGDTRTLDASLHEVGDTINCTIVAMSPEGYLGERAHASERTVIS